MTTCSTSVPDAPQLPTQGPDQGPQERHNRKRLFIAIAAVLAIGIVVGALLIPRGQSAIPLNVEYVVGERMVYGTSITANIPSLPFGLLGLSNNSLTVTGGQTVDVVAFDGQYYTLNHTVNMKLADYPATAVSVIEKMNKTGYSTYIFEFGSSTIGVSSTNGGFGGYLAQLLNNPEVRSGDSMTVPFPAALEKVGVEGSIKLTFSGVQDLTVPAGTFKVFRIDMTSSGMHFDTGALTNNSSTDASQMGITANLQSQTYIEYGTMRQIKSVMQEDITLESALMNFTINASMETILEQDLRPLNSS